MKNLYMMQTGIMYPNGTYLPYAAGAIAAFSLNDPAIAKEYLLKKIFCMREAPETIVRVLEAPVVFAFSCYVWNTQFNKAVASLVKQTYPECVVIFGGHNIPENDPSFLRENPFVDIVIYGEGERPFKGILEVVSGRRSFGSVNGIAYRENGEVVITPPNTENDVSELPSPYVMGLFDQILADYPETDFSAILETNRGCPYQCAFCDWCEQKSKIRSFPETRIKEDVLWMARHEIEFCYCADANFGILQRDESTVDFLICCKEKYGYPKKFRVNFAKRNNETVFSITEKLEASQLNKGATISFQSMTPETLKSIGRENMPISHFTELMERYRAAGISTYTEIILGLPEESYDDFCRGIGRLLAAGQHTTLFIYNCEIIVNSLMATPGYAARYGIGTAETTLYVRHNASRSDPIEEHSTSVVCTNKMNVDDWVRANLFSVLVQSCHSMGLLRFFALYCFSELGVAYEDFYKALQQFADTRRETFFGRTYADFEARFYGIVGGSGSWSCVVPEVGNVSWPYEEAFYIRLLLKKEAFFEEISDFLCRFSVAPDVFADILSYQKAVIKSPGRTEAELFLAYDLAPYFSGLLLGKKTALKKRSCRIVAEDESIPASLEAFARECIWFGRSVQKNLFTDLKVVYGDA